MEPIVFRRDVQALVNLFAEQDVAPYEELGVARARRAMEYVTRSQTPPTPVRIVRDIELPGATRPLRTRVYDPSPGTALPLVVYFHGGGWALGSIDAADGPCRRIARHARCGVVSIDYRLAPEAPFPAPLEDCITALDAIIDGPQSVREGTTGIVTMGDSAGGNLALSASLARRGRGLEPVDSQVLIYPVVTSPHDSPFPSMLQNADAPVLSAATMAWFWDTYLDGRTADARVDLLQVEDLSGLPRTLVATAGLDPLRDEGVELAVRLQDVGVATKLASYPGAVHGFWWLDGMLDQAAELDREIADFIANQSTGT